MFKDDSIAGIAPEMTLNVGVDHEDSTQMVKLGIFNLSFFPYLHWGSCSVICRDAEMRSMEVQRCGGAEVQRCGGKEVRR